MQPGTMKDPTIKRHSVAAKQREPKDVEVPKLDYFIEGTEHHVCTLCKPDWTFLSAETLRLHIDGSH
jgi:hypothetical protein